VEGPHCGWKLPPLPATGKGPHCVLCAKSLAFVPAIEGCWLILRSCCALVRWTSEGRTAVLTAWLAKKFQLFGESVTGRELIKRPAFVTRHASTPFLCQEAGRSRVVEK